MTTSKKSLQFLPAMYVMPLSLQSDRAEEDTGEISLTGICGTRTQGVYRGAQMRGPGGYRSIFSAQLSLYLETVKSETAVA